MTKKSNQVATAIFRGMIGLLGLVILILLVMNWESFDSLTFHFMSLSLGAHFFATADGESSEV
ncbi:MAG: hypothetical protein ACON4K_09995 [Akkermansiaceae bacterium]